MAKIQEIGPYSAYAIAKKYGYQGTEEEWVKEQEANRKAAEAAAAAAAQSAKDAAASASGAAQSGQQAVQSIKDAQTAAEQAIDTAKQQAVQAAQAEAEKAAASAGQAASSAAEAAQSATNAAAEVGKVQNAGTAAVQSVKEAQNTATGAVSDAQQTATQAVSQAQTAAVSAVQEAGTTQTSAVASAGTSAVADVSNAKTEALSQISAAGTAQVSAVGTAGADAVEDVNDAKTAALEAIDAANAALPSPTQSDAGKVPTVKADGSAYELAGPYAPLSAAIRPTVSGNPAVCEDSIAWAFQGLRIYGKSTQDGTPSPENPVPIVSAGERGGVEIAVTGKNLLNMSRCSAFAKSYGLTPVIDGDSVLISGTATTTMSIASFTILTTNDEFLVGRNFKFSWFTDQAIAYIFGLGTNNKINLAMSLQEGQSYNFAIKIFVWLEKLDAWEPYTGQSLTISTPNGLPGIPVDSGGNYTDASGRQWVCDVVDFETQTFLKNVCIANVKDLKISGFASYGSNGYFRITLDPSKDAIEDGSKSKSSYFETLYSFTSESEHFYWSRGSIQIFSKRWKSKDEFQAWLLSLNGDEVFAISIFKDPITTPLSDEELAAYRALHTCNGITVVSTAEDVAGLDVKYLADGEKYVERIVSQKAPEAAAAHTMALLADGIREGVNGV